MIDTSGQVFTNGDIRAVSFFTGNPASNGNNTLVAAAGAGLKIRVLAIDFEPSAAVNFKLQSGAGGTDITGLFTAGASGQRTLPYNKHGWCETAANALLNLSLSGAVAVGVTLTYCIVAA